MSLGDYTTAKFLCEPEVRTPVMVRFSAATSQPGSGDTARDIRAGRLVLEITPENQLELEPVFSCSPDTLASGMALIEGSFLHQLSLVIHTLENFRLGSARRTKLVNRHWRCPGTVPLPRMASLEDPRPKGADCRRGDWDGFDERERELIAKNIAQKLMFSEDDL